VFRLVTEWILAHTPAVRRALSRHLDGTGIEIGAGSQPFPLPHPGTTVLYLDRWLPGEQLELFDEVDDEPFTPPDIVCDLNVDQLGMLRDESLDFVIASHVLEHVANPIGLLDDIHRVLRCGGVAVVLLPDMQRTFDRNRPPTDLDHLIAEHEAGVTEVDDEHIREFLQYTDPGYQELVVDAEPAALRAVFDRHRRRSIHVHCWSERSFQPVIDHAICSLGHRWEFVDGIVTEDEGPDGLEFGYVLRRSTLDRAPDMVRAQFHSTYSDWLDQRRRVHATRHALMHAHNELAALRRRLRRTRKVLGAARQRLRRSYQPLVGSRRSATGCAGRAG
jgi:SAM-dependent methyltransferase